jgi:hypothetical protein
LGSSPNAGTERDCKNAIRACRQHVS